MNRMHDRRGLGAVEWAVIAGLITIVLVAGVAQLGNAVNQHLENTSIEFLADGSSASSGDSFWGGDNGSGDATDSGDDEAGNQDDSDDGNNSKGQSKGRGRGRRQS